MFRDAKEELRRLEQALMEEESSDEYEDDEYEDDEEYEEDGAFSDYEPYDEQIPSVSGPYRNFANNYRAYNSDRTDVDLDEYSEEVRNPRQNLSCLGGLVVFLLGGIAVMVGLFALKIYGIL